MRPRAATGGRVVLRVTLWFAWFTRALNRRRVRKVDLFRGLVAQMRAPLPDVDDLANRVSLHVERGPPLVRMVLDRFSEDAFVREFRDGDAKRPCQKCGRGKKLGLFEVTS